MQKLSVFCAVAVGYLVVAGSASSALINTYTGTGPAYTSNITTSASSVCTGCGTGNPLQPGDLVSGHGFVGGTPPNFTDADSDNIPEHYRWDSVPSDGHWLSDGNATNTEWVAFDLGATFVLEKMRVWNWEQSGSSGNNRALNTANIWYSTDASPVLPGGPALNPAGSGWTLLAGSPFTFQLPTVAVSYDTIDDVNFGVAARHVLIDVITNHGDDAYVGLAEVQFFGTPPVPEPSTFALLSLGSIGLAIRTRRRRPVV